MKSNYKPIGDLVERVDNRNKDGAISNLLGLSIDKKFIPSVANTIGTDLSTYKIIQKNDFAVSLMQVSRDSKIPVACQKEYEAAIMSPAYSIFRVKNEDEILPDYLEMWFKRSGFDREAAFIAVGGVRGSMPWEEFARIKVYVPPIEKQAAIVRQYKTIADRIALKQKINDNLETIAQTFFNYEMYKQKRNNLLESKKIRALGNVITGKTPPTNSPKYYGHDVPFIKTPDMHGTPFVMESEHWLSKLGADSQPNKYIPAFSLIVACIGANAGEVAITTCQAQTNQQINSVITKYPFYLYFSFKNKRDEFRALGDGSSTMLNINKSSFEDFEVDIPTAEQICHIESNLSSLFKAICKNQSEIKILNHIQQFIISQLGH